MKIFARKSLDQKLREKLREKVVFCDKKSHKFYPKNFTATFLATFSREILSIKSKISLINLSIKFLFEIFRRKFTFL